MRKWIMLSNGVYKPCTIKSRAQPIVAKATWPRKVSASHARRWQQCEAFVFHIPSTLDLTLTVL